MISLTVRRILYTNSIGAVRQQAALVYELVQRRVQTANLAVGAIAYYKASGTLDPGSWDGKLPAQRVDDQQWSASPPSNLTAWRAVSQPGSGI